MAPFLDRRAIDRDRPAIAVIRLVTEVAVILELAEVRQHLFPAPAGAALVNPVLEILRDAADRDLAVDGRAAADRAAAPQQLRLLPVGAARQQPRVTIVVVADGAQRVGDADVLRSVRRAEVATGLKQQDADSGIFGEAGGQHGAGRTAADDDEVVLVFHAAILLSPGDRARRHECARSGSRWR